MELSDADRRLVAAIQTGLPISPRPYEQIGRAAGMSEEDVIRRLAELLDSGVIRRLGVVVRHHELGYCANAMVVWDVPDVEVGAVGRRMADSPCVTLCYRRPRRPPAWTYNLFCMIHGRDRAAVEEQIGRLAAELGLEDIPRAVLFSRRRFKQRGAYYAGPPNGEHGKWMPSTARS